MALEEKRGEPVRGVVRSTDASSGVEITLYDLGETGTARTLQSNERLILRHVKAVLAPGGDLRVYVGADATEANGEMVVRGTVAANGGIVDDVYFVGETGHKPYVKAPSGVVDVILEGAIIQETTGGFTPSWKA